MLNHITQSCLRALIALQSFFTRSIDALVARARAAPQAGQGTVEYVALILLVAGVMAVAVGSAAKIGGLDKIIVDNLKGAIGKVGVGAK